MINKLKNLSKPAKIKIGIIAATVIVCAGIGVYFLTASNTETTDPVTNSDETIIAEVNEEKEVAEGTVVAKGEFDGEEGTIEGEKEEVAESTEIKTTTTTVEGETTTTTSTPKPSASETQSSTGTQSASTPKPESKPTEAPKVEATPTPAKCATCGSTDHINHPAEPTPVPATPETTPEPVTTPAPVVTPEPIPVATPKPADPTPAPQAPSEDKPIETVVPLPEPDEIIDMGGDDGSDNLDNIFG